MSELVVPVLGDEASSFMFWLWGSGPAAGVAGAGAGSACADPATTSTQSTTNTDTTKRETLVMSASFRRWRHMFLTICPEGGGAHPLALDLVEPGQGVSSELAVLGREGAGRRGGAGVAPASAAQPRVAPAEPGTTAPKRSVATSGRILRFPNGIEPCPTPPVERYFRAGHAPRSRLAANVSGRVGEPPWRGGVGGCRRGMKAGVWAA